MDLLSEIQKFDNNNAKKFLSEKSYMYLVGDRNLSLLESEVSEDSNDQDNENKLMSSTIIRTGDMIKLGRVCLYVKEWSLDSKRLREQEQSQEAEMKDLIKQYDSLRETNNTTKGTAETLDNLMDATNMSLNNISVASMRPYDQMSLELASFH